MKSPNFQQTRSVSLSDNNKLKEAQKPGIQKPKRVPAALKENEAS